MSSRGQFKALTALLLLMPQTPMLFQGQEFAASSPFHYFADQNAELARLISAGRAREMSQFPSVAQQPRYVIEKFSFLGTPAGESVVLGAEPTAPGVGYRITAV